MTDLPRQSFSRDELIAAMVARDVPLAKAKQFADQREAALSPIGAVAGGSVEANYVAIDPRRLDFPIRLVLPWSALISENRRFCARGNSIFMTGEYRLAREKVVAIARAAMTVDGLVFQPVAQPLSLRAVVYFPDNRVHDAPNFAGATHNALKKIVFVDDRWLYRVTWERAVAPDPDAPRAEIEIRPL